MSSKRQRMTWAALDREAAAAPAIPGYGVEDQGHPAHTQEDPGSAPYMIGTTSDFAEDVHHGPYGDSGRPALPGVGVEDQDHPAHQGQVGRKASLTELVRRKTAKALVLARATLGRTASWGDVEDQALAYMSMEDSALDASVGRLGGDFLGMDDELMGFDDMDDGMGDELMARMASLESELASMRAAHRMAALESELAGMRAAARKDDVTSDKAAHADPFLAMFDAYDTDGDGFVTSEDWGGPRGVFASLDVDHDGIIARHEVMAGCEKLPEALRGNCEAKKNGPKSDSDKDPSKKACDCEGSDKDDSDKKAARLAFGGLADFDDEELDMLQSMQFDDGLMGDEEDPAGFGVMASDSEKDEPEKDEPEKESSKKADAAFFDTGFDPMGLSDGTQLTAADKAAFNQVFGSDDGDDGGDKEASLEQMLRPQARKASQGVQTVGQVPRTASKRDEVDELSSLWASDPDVSSSFS